MRTEETVGIRGKDVQFKYWENGKKAKFTVYRPSVDYPVVRRCGQTRYPPNAETDYDFQNSVFQVRTDCEDWTPDMSGVIQGAVTCSHWAGPGCNSSPTDELAFQRWWQQSFPGIGSDVRWNENGKTRRMRNVWAFLPEFHAAIGHARALSFVTAPVPVEPPTELVSGSSGGTVRLRWSKAKTPRVSGYNIFRSEKRGGPYDRVNLRSESDASYLDQAGLVAGRIYYYQVKSIGPNGIQSEGGPIDAVRPGS